MHLVDAEAAQLVDDEGGGSGLLETQLGVGMELAALWPALLVLEHRGGWGGTALSRVPWPSAAC
jgi:Rad3-related DNA helicase